jgi:hypothetical protein
MVDHNCQTTEKNYLPGNIIFRRDAISVRYLVQGAQRIPPQVRMPCGFCMVF